MIMEYTGKEKRIKAWIIGKDFYFISITALGFVSPERLDF
jgi:hypothetical protein